MSDVAEPMILVELNFSSTEEGVDDKQGDTKVIWKDILREGKFAVTPGRRKRVPFSIVPEGTTSADDGIISMSDIIDGFDAKAFEHVTIPDGHPKKDDSALNNTGYVTALRTVKKKGIHFLQAALGFTEPDVAAKVRRGTVPNVSSGIFLGFTRKHDAKTFPACLNHVALTKTPIINDLDGFKAIYASDDDIDSDNLVVEAASFADDEGDGGSNGSADIVWNERDGSNWLRDELNAALTPQESADLSDGRPMQPRPSYYVDDISQSKNLALVTEWFKGDRTRWVIPFSVEDNSVKPAPATRWVEGQEALVAASEDFGDMATDAVTAKLAVCLLSDMDDDGFKVEQVTLDQRCKIRNTTTGAAFEAPFQVTKGGAVFLSDAADWTRVESSQAKPPASKPSPRSDIKDDAQSVPVFDMNTPEGRVKAARHRRRGQLAGKR